MRTTTPPGRTGTEAAQKDTSVTWTRGDDGAGSNGRVATWRLSWSCLLGRTSLLHPALFRSRFLCLFLIDHATVTGARQSQAHDGSLEVFRRLYGSRISCGTDSGIEISSVNSIPNNTDSYRDHEPDAEAGMMPST